jgi:hypothetical protein
MKDSHPLQIALAVLALLGIGVGIGAVITIALLNSPLRPNEVSVGPVSYEIPTSQPQTPVVNPGLPTATALPQGPSLQSLGTIRVFGNSNQGVQIQIPRSGVYRFAYRSGAYSTYPVGREPEGTSTWLTAIIIYRGDRAVWDGTRIKHESAFLRLADTSYRSSSEEAERSAQGQYLEAPLTEGEILTLIGVDHFDAYADNPGQVVIEWFFVQY